MSDKKIVMNLEAIMGDRFGKYSKYIIQERALPDVRDGLKPVQRRILYSMNKEGNTANKSYLLQLCVIQRLDFHQLQVNY